MNLDMKLLFFSPAIYFVAKRKNTWFGRRSGAQSAAATALISARSHSLPWGGVLPLLRIPLLSRVP